MWGQARKVDELRDKLENLILAWRKIGVQCQGFLPTMAISTWYHGSPRDLSVPEDHWTPHLKDTIPETYAGDCTRHSIQNQVPGDCHGSIAGSHRSISFGLVWGYQPMYNSHKIDDNPAVGNATGLLDAEQLALELIVPPLSDVEIYAEESLSRKMCCHQRTCQWCIIWLLIIINIDSVPLEIVIVTHFNIFYSHVLLCYELLTPIKSWWTAK